MKSNYVRHLYDNVCSKEVSLVFSQIRCFGFVSLLEKKKRYQNKLDSDVSIVSTNNKSEVSGKLRLELGESFLVCR